MENSTLRISLDHLHILRHALGFVPNAANKKEHKPHRNRYIIMRDSEPPQELLELVGMGLMEAFKQPDGGTLYVVTDAGKSMLGAIYERTIL